MYSHLRSCLLGIIAVSTFYGPQIWADELGQGGSINTLPQEQAAARIKNLAVPHEDLRKAIPASATVTPPVVKPINDGKHFVVNGNTNNGFEIVLQVKPVAGTSEPVAAPVSTVKTPGKVLIARKAPMLERGGMTPGARIFERRGVTKKAPVTEKARINEKAPITARTMTADSLLRKPITLGQSPTTKTKSVLTYKYDHRPMTVEHKNPRQIKESTSKAISSDQLVKILNSSVNAKRPQIKLDAPVAVKPDASHPTLPAVEVSDTKWVPTSTALQHFTVFKGDTLLAALQKFSERYGWTVVSDSDQDLQILLDNSITYTSFEGGLKKLIDGYPVRAQLYLRNKVVKIIFF